MDPRGLRVTQTTYFSLLTHAMQLSFVISCDTTAGIGKKWKCDVRTGEQTDVKSEIAIQMRTICHYIYEKYVVDEIVFTLKPGKLYLYLWTLNRRCFLYSFCVRNRVWSCRRLHASSHGNARTWHRSGWSHCRGLQAIFFQKQCFCMMQGCRWEFKLMGERLLSSY